MTVLSSKLHLGHQQNATHLQVSSFIRKSSGQMYFLKLSAASIHSALLLAGIPCITHSLGHEKFNHSVLELQSLKLDSDCNVVKCSQ